MHKLWSEHSSDVSSKEKWEELKKELNARVCIQGWTWGDHLVY